jgi:hypothetical protein
MYTLIIDVYSDLSSPSSAWVNEWTCAVIGRAAVTTKWPAPAPPVVLTGVIEWLLPFVHYCLPDM